MRWTMAELIGLREFDYKIIRAMGENAGDLAAVAEILHRSEAEICKRLIQIRAFFDQQKKQPEPETDGEIIVRKLCSVAKLSAMQRAALILVYDGRTHEQIGKQFGITRPAVTRRILRAAQRLKDAGANVPPFPRAYSAPRERWADFR